MAILTYLLCSIICLVGLAILVLAYLYALAEFESRKTEPEAFVCQQDSEANPEGDPALPGAASPAPAQAENQPASAVPSLRPTQHRAGL